MPVIEEAALRELTLRDEQHLRRQARGLRRNEQGRARFERQLAEARARVQRRHASVPEVSYPPQLPVSARREDLLAAIRDHPVVVVAGETGSGKTTQLPKICLELGRGVRGAIAHTQPRRIAARTVAQRIADELDARWAVPSVTRSGLMTEGRRTRWSVWSRTVCCSPSCAGIRCCAATTR